VHSDGIPADSGGIPTQGTGRSGSGPEQAPECAISLSGKRVFDIAGIRVSEISVYYENRRVVPM
jgi:hypothetical protein